MKVALLFSLCCPAGAFQSGCATTPTTRLLDAEMCWTAYYARAYGIPLAFVQAIIDVESAWQPYAVSTKGAAGIMQLTAPTAFTFGVINRFRIEENIRGGVAYLAYLSRRFGGELRLVAAAYYAGEQRIRRLGLSCADIDVYSYVSAVQRFYARRQMAAGAASRYTFQGARHP